MVMPSLLGCTMVVFPDAMPLEDSPRACPAACLTLIYFPVRDSATIDVKDGRCRTASCREGVVLTALKVLHRLWFRAFINALFGKLVFSAGAPLAIIGYRNQLNGVIYATTWPGALWRCKTDVRPSWRLASPLLHHTRCTGCGRWVFPGLDIIASIISSVSSSS